ncbi:hypothetical protein OC844_005044 [Tilletia horrida]|nr:hypothetical protein OC844_005044 [Tilletia horrida]
MPADFLPPYKDVAAAAAARDAAAASDTDSLPPPSPVKAHTPSPSMRLRRAHFSIHGLLKLVFCAALATYFLGPSIQTMRGCLTGQHRIIEHDPNSPSGRLNFTPCFPSPAKDTNQHKWQCGYLDVPLDYTNASDPRTARIALVMYQAGTHKSNRTIVLNPGGPGGSGTSLAWIAGEKYSKDYSDGTFDVLGFDPRGVNMSTPSSACHKHDVFRDRWSAFSHQFTDTFDHGDTDLSAGEKHLRITDVYFQAMWKACEEKNGDLGRFLTTAFVARDVDAIRHALGEDELTAIVYSYGTNLMQTYAAMFPHRVGRIVLDGVQYARLTRSPFDWGRSTNGNATDTFYKGFLTECIKAGPDACELAKINGTVQTLDSVKEHIHNLLGALRVLPLPATHPEQGAGLVTYESVVSSIFESTYVPASWPKITKMLKELLEGNATLALAAHGWQYNPLKENGANRRRPSWRGVEAPEATTAELLFHVVCGDAYDAPKEPWDYWMRYYHDARVRSWIWPGSFFPIILSCRTYHNSYGPPAEVYRGNFTAPLKNPLLLIAGSYDPVTPIPNARMVQREWGSENVRLVINKGFGHCAVNDPSKCTDAIKRRVILEGKWPSEAERECEVDHKPFEKKPEEGKEAKNATTTLDLESVLVPWAPHQRRRRSVE